MLYFHFGQGHCECTSTRFEPKIWFKNSLKIKIASNTIRGDFRNFVTPKVHMSNTFIEEVKKLWR